MSEFTVVGLRVVREAARHGSFSTAAERLGYTQSAVSRQIALMERAAGQVLFERGARGVRPTAAGRVVVRYAESVLGELQAARQDLRDLGARPAARLRVGAFSTAMAALVPRAIAVMAAREPQVRIPLREGLSAALLTSVARGRLDLAVVAVPEGVDGLVHLVDDPLFIAVAPGHPLAGEASVDPALLRRERWIAGSADPASSLLGAWADRPEVAFVARDWMAKLGLVAAGLGITVVPGLAVPALPSPLDVVRIDHPSAVRRTALAVGANDRPREAFVEALRDVAAELASTQRHRLR
ncbi:LysR family transcriptional regulator [Spirillospora sp. CA-294931]|uniref:LysR family transcriptional regulator n=1 Tax=Spirillospora sp. CA-294931 TaxID=3240042 RepID=UPI003D8F84C5